MAGIYIHIPFCRQACHYCNFHFTTSLHYKHDLIAALLKEITLQKDYLDNELVETIYFGGGTPSLCTKEEVKSILTAIHSSFIVAKDAEITFETNPDDITEEKLKEWKETGINRLSIGIQSFFEEDLKWMNRAHTARQAIDSLQSAIKAFENITIDLIYGTPQLTNEKWKKNVETAISLNIPHLSCYALTVESKTPLYKMIRQHKKEDINPDKQSEQFLLLMEWLEKAGYEHYEISNFSKMAAPGGWPGFRSRHNSSYWQGRKYLGLGPSAHSFNGTSRQWNILNNKNYIDSISNQSIPFEIEVLTETQKLNEYIMTSLRTIEGIQIDIAGKDVVARAKRFIDSGLMKQENDSLILTREGKLLADGITAELFF
ncbi:MAG: radical SAM family heme chaperone HemW [Chitinophagaceae bacterium]|nr:radical SAM family heme chaperone HemW [Chitinophagaceae bacterium]MBL0272518.1 radical SAM family heme chaperone HemW [Chitinophagaceae bacterium]